MHTSKTPDEDEEEDSKQGKKKFSPAARRRRPRSAPAPKKRPQQQQQQHSPKVDLRSYSKSLRLLGFDIPSNRREATKLTHQVRKKGKCNGGESINICFFYFQDIVIRTKSPTVRTRLKHRTQSVSDLQDVIDAKHHLPK